MWATLAPRSLYDELPGGGRSWVATDGPDNEHLIRDLGALTRPWWPPSPPPS